MSKRIIAIIMLICMCMSIIPLSVYADESSDYDMHKLVSTGYYEAGNGWCQYYHPNGNFSDFFVAYESNGNSSRMPSEASKFYIYFYNPENTTVKVGSTMTFSTEVMTTTANTMEEVYQILYEGGTFDFQTQKTGCSWSCTWLYSGELKGYRNHAAESVESSFYNYTYEKYGYYPITTSIEINYIFDGAVLIEDYVSCIAGESLKLSDYIFAPEDYKINSIARGDVLYDITDTVVFYEDTKITVELLESSPNDFKGIIDTLKDILNVLKSLTSLDYIGALGKVWPDAKQMLSEQLADNEFYTSVTKIMVTLKDLYNEDYTDPEKFYNLKIFKVNLGVPEKVYYKDYGNEVIGSWEKVERVEKYTIFGREVNFGLENVSFFNATNFGWYFGEKFEDGTYTKGLKPTIDAFLSAWLWVMFCFALWRNFSNLVTGDLTALGNTAVHSYTAEVRENEKLELQKYRESYEYYEKERKRREMHELSYDISKKGKIENQMNKFTDKFKEYQKNAENKMIDLAAKEKAVRDMNKKKGE